MLTSNRSGRSGKMVSHESRDGIDVIRIRNRYDNDMGSARRIVSFLTFMTISTAVSLRQKNVDLIFATSTPLTVGIPALINKLFRRRSYIFEVRDLWPEFPIQMGAVKSTAVIRALRYFERTIYKHATLIIALSPGMKGPIDALGFAEKTIMIPNMAKPKEFFPRPSNKSVLKQFNINPESLKIVYFGALGRANNIPHLVREIQYASEQNLPVQFLIIGEGAMGEQAQKDLSEVSNKKYIFLGNQNMENVSAIVNECQISVTSFLNLPILETNSPNKFFDSLSAGKPSAINVHGWIQDLVEKHECGFYTNPEIRGDLVDKSLALYQDTARYTRYCENSRALALNEFDRSNLAKKLVDSIPV